MSPHGWQTFDGSYEDYVAAALAELDRLQATATRRGELLERVLPYIARRVYDELRAAIVAELADGEDGRA